MLREGARPEIARDILGHANIDVTQNVTARAGGKSEWVAPRIARSHLVIELHLRSAISSAAHHGKPPIKFDAR